MKNKGPIITILVGIILMMVGVFLTGFILGKWYEANKQHKIALVTQNQDADTINPRLSDKEMFGSDMTIVVPSAKGNSAHVRKTNARPSHSHVSKATMENEDADTVNQHIPEADIGAEILAVNSGHHHHK